jgi:hypothetical protein
MCSISDSKKKDNWRPGLSDHGRERTDADFSDIVSPIRGPPRFSHTMNKLSGGSMATGSSIVGTWNVFVDWGGGGKPIFALPLTFNVDGSWTYQFGGGQWIQMEGMYFFNFTDAAGLVYTANVTVDTVSGIMGYAVAGGQSSGVWWGTRPGSPQPTEEQERASAGAEHDALVGPVNG